MISSRHDRPKRATLIAVIAMTAGAMTTNTLAQDAPQAQVLKNGERETVVTKAFKAPRAAVFRAFTSCEAIEEWMKPERMTLSECSVDARAGGSLRLVFLAAKDRRVEVRDVYRVLDAPRRIQYEESYDFSPLTISVTATLEESNGETQFRETLVYRSTAERDADFRGIAESVPAVYAKLDRYLRES
jgi:uncharacterized protein YndB with AHSA1/START domain